VLYCEKNNVFALVILEMGVSRTTCPGWPQTMIFLIPDTQVVRIIDVSHQHLAEVFFFILFNNFLLANINCTKGFHCGISTHTYNVL
jgi:hypothetical protein